jgi:excisionase family DNA binding protein
MSRHQHLDRKVLTVAELCDYLRVHKTTVYRLIKRGEIPAFRIGSDWRFNIETIEKWRGVLNQ